MNKALTVVVPALQVLAFAALLELKSLSMSSYKVNSDVYLPASDVMMRLNYPLTALWFCVDYATSWLRLPEPGAGWEATMLTLIVGALLLSSVALFWYGVVREFEMRRKGMSLLRFRGWFWPLFAIFILLLLGCGALFSVYSDARVRIPLMLHTGSALGLALTLIPEIVLLVWATVLIGASAVDFRKFLRTIHVDKALVN